MYRLLRPLLFRLDAERAHQLGLVAARFIANRRWLAIALERVMARPAALRVRTAGLQFPNPVGLAAGLDKNAEAPLTWWALGFGFIEIGTVTPQHQSGQSPPRLFRLSRQGALVNRMGFDNDGAETVARRLKQQAESGLRPPIPIGISVGKNANTLLSNAARDYSQATEQLAPWADFLTLNVSSPNTDGLRTLQAPAKVAELVQAVRTASGTKPCLVKLAPELDGAQLDRTVDSCLEAGAAGFITTNTLSTAGRTDLPEGGLSGRPLHSIALQRVEAVRKRAGSGVTIIGCGGVDDITGASAMLQAGADLIQLYTGLVFRGPFLPAKITRVVAPRTLQ